MSGTIMSVLATAAATTTAVTSGNTVMAWAMTIANVLILLSNTFIDIYRKWRDRDKDLKSSEERKDKEESDDDKDV